ncbi:unnamed protein product [Cladocopium goreaui]|uniref:Uncharacterized protein n=1 Tax=Cladocopium goreaui TaxID=2562237 RepID=A0A9P1CX20_9DINO|nr:unnamed protein product [Cladocopium goreaui]
MATSRRPPAYASFVAAGVAATAELMVMQPLDVVKTRMHLQGDGIKSGDNFQGTLAAMRGIRQAEGMAGLWRGFVPGLCVVIPRRGFKFVFYDAFIKLLWKGEKQKAPFQHSLVAGGLAGASEACIITPLECLKIGMQSEKAAGSSATGMASFARAMVRSGGVGSLYAGLGATVAKHTAHSCFYFAAFHETKKFAPKGTSRFQQICWDLLSGFVAGCAAATANNPFDVVKTRQQVVAASALSSHAAGQARPSKPGRFFKSLKLRRHAHDYRCAGVSSTMVVRWSPFQKVQPLEGHHAKGALTGQPKHSIMS